jgi:hypothetical protein
VLTISGLSNQGELSLMDLFGKNILTIPYQSHTIQINLTELKSGIYFLSDPNKGIYEKVIKNE